MAANDNEEPDFTLISADCAMVEDGREVQEALDMAVCEAEILAILCSEKGRV